MAGSREYGDEPAKSTLMPHVLINKTEVKTWKYVLHVSMRILWETPVSSLKLNDYYANKFVTNSMDQSQSRESGSCSASQDISYNFMESVVLLLCSQEPTTSPYLELDESSPYPLILSRNNPF
jgi:hypothetical protein